jgi:AcrR family transcriptional regulator
MPRTEETDATRARLIEAAGQVFAEHGFRSATVREICARAGANVAAVNYHFRDKMGLYIAAVRQSICESHAENFPEELLRSETPENLLRLTISGMLHRVCRAGEQGGWHLRIMAHEMAEPTEALPRVVEEIIGPRYLHIRRLVSRIIGLPPAHDTTRLCAHSVIAQVIHYVHARPVIACVWPDLKMTPRRLEQIAAHIADFSICALHEIALKNKGIPNE